MRKHETLTIPTTEEAELTIIPAFQSRPFVITGDTETLVPIATEAYEAAQHDATRKPKQTPVQAPQPAPKRELAYEDFSTLKGSQIARMKVSAWFYDRAHQTQMLDLLNERIDNDRDVAYARSLGLLSVTRCAKHEKAVSTLRRIVQS